MTMMDHRFDIIDKATFRNGMSRLGWQSMSSRQSQVTGA